MFSASSIIQQWLLALLAIPANAVAGLPIIMALGLVAGRRGHAEFCLRANFFLLKFAAALAVFAPFYHFLDYILQILPLTPPGGSLLAPLLKPAGMSFSCVLILDCMALGLIFAAKSSLQRIAFDLGDRYPLRLVRLPAALCLLAAFCYLAGMWLASWPFAGLPEGMGWDAAVMAIGRNAMRHYFTSFCPAGALALCVSLKFAFASSEQQSIGTRWLACWAAAGYFPQTLISLGLVLGQGARSILGNGPAFGILEQSLNTGFTLAAMACWILLIAGRGKKDALIMAGFFFLVLKASAAGIAKCIYLI